MERLTARAGNHTYYRYCGTVAVCPKQGCGACEITQRAKDKLAAYEDMEEKLEEAREEREKVFGEEDDKEAIMDAILELVKAGYEVCRENCKHLESACTGESAYTDAALENLFENHCAKCPLGKIL